MPHLLQSYLLCLKHPLSCNFISRHREVQLNMCRHVQIVMNISCHTRLSVAVQCNVLVAYSVFFVLRIKSVRSSGCLLYSLYFWEEDLVC